MLIDDRPTLIRAFGREGVTETARLCSIKANKIIRGTAMSHEYLTSKNKNPKVHFQQYLYNSNEPRDDISGASPSELETELLEDSYLMRRRFRHIAQDIRRHYS
jgi:hypothetical protein